MYLFMYIIISWRSKLFWFYIICFHQDSTHGQNCQIVLFFAASFCPLQDIKTCRLSGSTHFLLIGNYSLSDSLITQNSHLNEEIWLKWHMECQIAQTCPCVLKHITTWTLMHHMPDQAICLFKKALGFRFLLLIVLWSEG